MSSAPRPRRPLSAGLAALATAIPLFRAGTSLPGASAPLVAAPASSAHRPGRTGRGRLRRSMRISCAEGMAAEVFTACAGGSILTGWALHLGFSPFLVAVLGALPFLSQLVQFPAAWMTSRFGGRRTALVAVGASRLVMAPLVVLPFLGLSLPLQRGVLLGVASLSAVLAVVGNNAWVAWMSDVVPAAIRGRYFGRRTALCTVGSTLAALFAGVLLDAARSRGLGGEALGALAAVACLAGLATTALMALQHETRDTAALRPRARLSDVQVPLADPNGRRILAYQLAWNASIGISSAFFALHSLQNLRMGFTLMAVHAAAVAGVRYLMAPVWGRAIDRFGAQPVLALCSSANLLIPLVWLPARADFLWPLLADVVLSGTLWSGHALAIFNLPLATTPRATRPFYLAAFSTAGGVAFTLASGVGGVLASLLPSTLGGGGWVNLHVLFLLSALGRGAASLLALRIVEPGALPMGSLVRAALAVVRPGRVPEAGAVRPGL